MTFDIGNLNIGGDPSGGAGTLHTYRSSGDAIATVLGLGYFDGGKQLFKVGDFMFAKGSNGAAFAQISGIDPVSLSEQDLGPSLNLADFYPSAWWDFSDTASVTLSGSEISDIESKVRGSVISEATSAARPTTTTVNGLQAALFDATDDEMNNATGVPAGDLYAVGFVVSLASEVTPATAAKGVMTLNATNNANIAFGAVSGLLTDEVLSLRTSDSGTVLGYGGSSVTIAAGQHSVFFAWDGSNYNTYLDGVDVGNLSAGTETLIDETLAIRPGNDTTSGGHLGDTLCEIVCFDRQLSPYEITRIHNHWAAKWGI